MKKPEILTVSRRDFTKTLAFRSAGGFSDYQGMNEPAENTQEIKSQGKIKITDVKCAIIANSPVVLITTDAGEDKKLFD